MGKSECVHRWNIDSQNVGTCSKCGEVRQFPMEKGGKPVTLKGGTPGAMRGIKRGRGGYNHVSRHDYYQDHRAEITSDILTLGRVATRSKWGIPQGTLSKLEGRFLTREQQDRLNQGELPGAPPGPGTGLPVPDHKDGTIPLELTMGELDMMINLGSRQLQADITRNIFDRSLTGLVQKGADAKALKLLNDDKEKTPA